MTACVKSQALTSRIMQQSMYVPAASLHLSSVCCAAVGAVRYATNAEAEAAVAMLNGAAMDESTLEVATPHPNKGSDAIPFKEDDKALPW